MKIQNKDMKIEELQEHDVITEIQAAVDNWKTTRQQFRTSKLWIMYMKMVSILRSFIKSARTGNWLLYIQSLHEMLPYLAAAGHNNYVKSIVLHLQKLRQLPQTHPDVFSKFIDGNFVIRQTNKYWAGIFTDHGIEQILMGNIKSVGGLTRGRGFDENTSLVWLLSMPACGEVNKALDELTGKSSDALEHKDLSKTRIARNAKDVGTIVDFFVERKPFRETIDLCRPTTGVFADTSIDVDNAEHIGTCILSSMEGKSVSDFKFTKKQQAKGLESVKYVAVNGEKLILTQRFYIKGFLWQVLEIWILMF